MRLRIGARTIIVRVFTAVIRRIFLDGFHILGLSVSVFAAFFSHFGFCLLDLDFQILFEQFSLFPRLKALLAFTVRSRLNLNLAILLLIRVDLGTQDFLKLFILEQLFPSLLLFILLISSIRIDQRENFVELFIFRLLLLNHAVVNFLLDVSIFLKFAQSQILFYLPEHLDKHIKEINQNDQAE